MEGGIGGEDLSEYTGGLEAGTLGGPEGTRGGPEFRETGVPLLEEDEGKDDEDDEEEDDDDDEEEVGLDFFAAASRALAEEKASSPRLSGSLVKSIAGIPESKTELKNILKYLVKNGVENI